MSRGPAYIVNNRIIRSPERSVITAGHCTLGQTPGAPWNQGGSLLGNYARQGLRNPARCDCSTVQTQDSLFKYRGVSDQIFQGPSLTPFTVTDIQALNYGARDDRVCISAAITGYQCGKLHTGGRGNVFTLHYGGQVFRILGVHSAYFKKGFASGDSGAPMFNPHPSKQDKSAAFGLGIFFADSPRNHAKAYFAQAYNVQAQLNVSICTKTNPC